MDLLIYGKVKSSGGASFPTNLAAANLTETGFTLRWAGVAGATQYEVFRDAVSLGTTDSLAFAVTGVTINTTYAMTVRAQTGGGTWSELSLPLQVTIPDQTAPTTPGNLSVTGITENSFVLHWDPASDNVAVTRYEILMNGSLYGNTVDDYLPVPYLQPSTRYSMRVRARDQAGNVSGLSDSLVVFTSPTGVAPAAARQPGPAAAVIAFRHAGTVCTRDLGPAGAAGPLSLRVSDMRGRTLLCLGSLSPGLRVDATWLPKGAHVLDLRRGTSHSRSMLLVD